MATRAPLSVEFLRCGQPDPAVAAGDKIFLSASLPMSSLLLIFD